MVEYLNVEDSPLLKNIFQGEQYTLYKLIEMDNFFRSRDEISVPNERGDRLKISNKDSSPANIDQMNSGLFKILEDPKNGA